MSNINIYKAESRIETGFLKVWYLMLKNIYNARDLIWQMFRRDFLMAYKRSFIGIGWLILSPIIGIVSWVFMNSTGILNPGDTGVDYAPYVLLSTSIWGLFIGFYSSAAGTLSTAHAFILQVKFTHEAMLVKQILQNIAGFTINFLITITVLLLLGVVPNIGILLFPILVLPLLFVGAGIGLVMSVVNVVASDINQFVDKAMALLLLVTPVVYSVNAQDPGLIELIKLNPMTYLISAPRDMLFFGELNNAPIFLIISLASFVFFMLSLRLFYLAELKVIEKMQ